MHDIARIARLTCLVLILIVARASTSSAQLISSAPLRTPQAVIHGTGLRDYFTSTSVGESIAPSTDQRDAGLLNGSVSGNATYNLQIEMGPNPHGLETGIYNGYDVNPALMRVLPAAATVGWFAVVAFRTAPVRAVVSLFDADASFQGQTTYLGAAKGGVGLYVQGAGGTFYSQDERNSGAAPQLLFFAGTGWNAGSAWVAVEDQPVSGGADGDYADLILLVENIQEYSAGVTSTRHTTWGELKSRFR